MKTDLLLNTAYNLREDLATHDFVEGRSDEQHQNLLINTEKGAWKENPDTGVGAYQFLEGEDAAGLLREIRQQFAADGMEMNRLDVTGDKLNVDATYL